jgi:hypothetical protein
VRPKILLLPLALLLFSFDSKHRFVGTWECTELNEAVGWYPAKFIFDEKDSFRQFIYFTEEGEPDTLKWDGAYSASGDTLILFYSDADVVRYKISSFSPGKEMALNLLWPQEDHGEGDYEEITDPVDYNGEVITGDDAEQPIDYTAPTHIFKKVSE